MILLRNSVLTEDDVRSVPVLNPLKFPLADADSLRAAGWPKAVGIEVRVILGVSTYAVIFCLVHK
jgi:hypothetical protein